MPSSSSNSSSSGGNLIFAEFQGNFIRKDGICYEFLQTTTNPENSTPDGVEIFSDCLTCIYDDNSSSSGSDLAFPYTFPIEFSS
jgi:hypothetical protein